MKASHIYCAIFLSSIISKRKDSSSFYDNDYDIFSVKKLPSISLVNFSSRLYSLLNCSDCCYILSIALIEKLLILNPGFNINEYNIHKYF